MVRSYEILNIEVTFSKSSNECLYWNGLIAYRLERVNLWLETSICCADNLFYFFQ